MLLGLHWPFLALWVMAKMGFTIQVQFQITKLLIYRPEGQLLNNHNHIFTHNNNNTYDWLIKTDHGDYKKKWERKGRIKQSSRHLYYSCQEKQSFSFRPSKICCKTFQAESYPHLPDVLLQEKCHLFYITDTMPRTSHLWGNDITFYIPENGIK